MTTLAKLSNYLAEVRPHGKGRQLIVEAKAAIEILEKRLVNAIEFAERLEKENAKLKSAMIAIYGICDGPGEDHSFKAARIAQEALSE